uniref:Selenium-binding protein 1 n=1 Tax=Romanomermis culicivorax TaxID=13658 RepID=A0A915J8G2_ROMCU
MTPFQSQKSKMEGGCQMVQLSIDGRRLYVTDSLYSGWDQKLYPNLIQNGSTLLRLSVDNENKEVKFDDKFCVKFEHEPDGPVLAHEIRYPGGDCTSDIFV